MVNYKCWRQAGEIMKSDVRRLREEIQPGDYVLVEMEKEEEIGGRIRIKTGLRKRRVIAKFRNLVWVTGKGTKIHTVTYKEILMNELKRMRRENEGSMG